jgi:hypothetical protein
MGELDSSQKLPDFGVALTPTAPVFPGGITRPWVKQIPKAPRKIQETDGVMVLWEHGAMTTGELKQEIKILLEKGHTLVEILDSKRAEHPEDPTWWPSLMEVMRWCVTDQQFGQLLDLWNHAHQLELLESVTHEVLGPGADSVDPKLLKVKVDFASKVLPRIVNKGLRERVDVNNTHNFTGGGLDARGMSDDALDGRLAELAHNPKVKKFLVEHLGTEKALETLKNRVVIESEIRPGEEYIDVLPEIPDPESK